MDFDAPDNIESLIPETREKAGVVAEFCADSREQRSSVASTEFRRH